MRKALAAAVLGLVLAAPPALADGKVFPLRPAGPADGRAAGEIAVDPVIPDQRALIVHRDGRETLVVETAFEGRGTDFAWVVPTPSVPRIEKASPELFPALAEASRPELVSRVPALGLAGVLAVGALVFARHGGRRRRAGALVLAGAAALAFVGPATDGRAGRLVLAGNLLGVDMSVPMTGAEEPVTVKQREVVGVYDTTTLVARDGAALGNWLAENGYAAPPGIEEVAARYVADGWYFTAIRLHRESDVTEAVRIHPLAFTFDVREPVYPMRLTGVTSAPVRVELYVAGNRQAQAPGFSTSRAARIDADPGHEGDRAHVVFRDTAANDWLSGARTFTRLDGVLAPGQMKEDVPVTFTDFEPVERVVLSERASAAMAMNLGALAAIGLLLGLASADAVPRTRRNRLSASRRWAWTGLVLFAALDVGLGVALFTPTMPSRPATAAAR